MWISWSTKSPIMNDLGRLPTGIEFCDSPLPEYKHFIEYSVATNTAYASQHIDRYAICIRTIEDFQKAVFLLSLGMLNKEIQQHIDLGTTDDT